MGLFEPIWKSKDVKDIEKIKAYIEKIGNSSKGETRDNKMLKIINEAFLEEVKIAAVEWVSSPLILKALLMEGKYVSVAARRITANVDQSIFKLVNEFLMDINCPNEVIAPLLHSFFNSQSEIFRTRYFFSVDAAKKDNNFPYFEKIIANAEAKRIAFAIEEKKYSVSQKAEFIVLNPTAEKTYGVIKCYVRDGLKYDQYGLPTTEGIAMYKHQTEMKEANARGYNILKIPTGTVIGCIHIANDTITEI